MAAPPAIELALLHRDREVAESLGAAVSDLARVTASSAADDVLMAVAGTRAPLVVSEWFPGGWPGFDAQLEPLCGDAIRVALVADADAEALGGAALADRLAGVVRLPASSAGFRAAVKAALNVRRLRAAVAEERSRSEREFESFVRAVSHDLKAPLQGVLGIAGLLVERNRDTLPDKTLGYLERIENDAERLGGMIHALALYSRLGRGGLRTQRLSLLEVVDEAYAVAIGAHSSRIPHLTFDDSLPRLVADRGLLETLVGQLVDNALIFNDSKPPRVHIGWQDAEGPEPGGVLTVTDNGLGLPGSMHEEVFEMFGRHHRDRAGVGAGLAMVRRAAMLHGGRARLESVEGEGCTVFVHLPVPVSRDGS